MPQMVRLMQSGKFLVWSTHQLLLRQLWDLLTASLPAGKEHKPHLFLFLRLQVQTTWDSFRLLTWLTIKRGNCVKGYCSISAPKYSRAQDYIHWHGFWVCSPRGGGRFPFLWDDATLTVVHNQIWRQRQMVSADLLLWETGLEKSGSNMPARTSSRSANRHGSNTQPCCSMQAPSQKKDF